MMRSSRRFIVAAAFFILLGTGWFPGALQAAAGAPKSTGWRRHFPNSLKKIPASTATVLTGPGAAIDKAETIDFQIVLRMRDFPKLLARQAAGDTISQAEMAARYYPLKSDYENLAKWAGKQGLVVTKKDTHFMVLGVRGPVLKLQKALAASFAHVNVSGRQFTAALTSPSLPASVAAPVLAITGLQPYLRAHKIDGDSGGFTKQTGNQPPYLIGEILHAYDADHLAVNGANQKIGILIDTVPNNSDLVAFWNANSIPQSLSNIEKVDVLGLNDLPPATGEETLDVEWTSGIASGAKIRIYATTDLYFNDIDKALQQIIDDLPAQPQMRQLSISLGLGEQYISPDEITAESQYFATIASYGVSIFVSTGDGGSNPDEGGHDPGAGPLQVEYFSSDPSVTGVGGTRLTLNPTSGDVSRETGWPDGGGGESIFFARPSYQTGTGFPAGNKRLVPDVSLPADPNTGCYLVLNGDIGQYGGTSWSAPTWAGFSAMINQARAGAGLPSLGLLNPKVYPLLGTANFRDIQAGSNGAYTAGVGYDEVTGLGVPDVGVLLQTLAGGPGGSSFAITGFTPTSGGAGTTVTIQGTLLDQVTGVSFNGVGATFTTSSATQINAVVPAGATSGFITATNGRATAASASAFTVIAANRGNDDFANAQVLPGASGTVSGSNVGATKEAGEPDHANDSGGASIWYSWTAPASGTFTFTTDGSSFDTLLAVYTGTRVDHLSEVASDDDAGGGVTSRVTFNATAGVVYKIAVDGYDDSIGSVTLGYGPNSVAPVVGDFTPDRGGPGTLVTIYGANFTSATNVLFNGAQAGFDVDGDGQITATAPANATTGVISVVSSAGTGLSSNYFLLETPPANDNFANALVLPGSSGTVRGANDGATYEHGEPLHAGEEGSASVWYVWTAPASGIVNFDTEGSSFDTLLAAYTGTAVDALSEVASNDDTATALTSSITFQAVAGGVYHIAVDGYYGVTGSVVLNYNAKAGIGPPVITSGLNVSGQVGAAFNYQITATNSPDGFAARGLPPGLTVDATTGVIAGVPTAAGTFSATVSATNAGGAGTATLSIVVAGPPAPVITSATSAFARLYSIFTYQITATNGPTSFTARGLPAGLTFDSAMGVISGAPTAEGVFDIALGAANTGGTGTADLMVTVSDGIPVITSALTAAAQVGSAYSYQITASNAPISFEAGALPPGLTVNTVTGLVSGTPTMAGHFAAALSATNSLGTGTANLSVTVAPPASIAPIIISNLTASAQVGAVFTYQIAAAHAPTSFTATGVPAGLSFDPATGVISGAAKDVGTFPIALSAVNQGGSDHATLTLTVISDVPAVSLFAGADITAGDGEVGQLTATRAGGDLSQPLEVYYTVSGSAIPGADYQALKGMFKFRAGKTAKTIKIVSYGNAGGPGQKRVVKLKLLTASAYTVGTTKRAKLTILGK